MIDLYYGIRPTGNNLHIGHVLSILNMFNELKNNSNIDNIYVLLAEIHSEISTLNKNEIRNNSIILSKKIISLYKLFLIRNNLSLDNLNKLKFILQNNEVSKYHLTLTYKFLPLISTSSLTKNPIYKNTKNKNIAFLLYPVLQSFDVLLYTNKNNKCIVFLSSDQNANISIMKDIYKKLNISNVEIKIYDNVIYDIKGQKISKSLNNVINFDDYKNIKEFIIKYISNIDDCKLFNSIINPLCNSLNINFTKKCNFKNKCFECKTQFLNELTNIINSYIYNFDNIKNVINYLNYLSVDYVLNNYNSLLNKIEFIRTK